MHSIFQISISHNTICVDMVDFRKPGHICTTSYITNNIYHLLKDKIFHPVEGVSGQDDQYSKLTD